MLDSLRKYFLLHGADMIANKLKIAVYAFALNALLLCTNAYCELESACVQLQDAMQVCNDQMMTELTRCSNFRDQAVDA